jgi:hypothetical protein
MENYENNKGNDSEFEEYLESTRRDFGSGDHEQSPI